MRLLLFVFGLMLTLLATGCGDKMNAPLRLFFIGSGRFTTGGRTLTQPDTLATRLYATVDDTNPAGLQNFTAKVTYTPLRAPFAYPAPPNQFNYASLARTSETIIYLDTTFAAGTRELLYTQVFGSRTTSGSERWEFIITDGKNTSSRTLTLAVRRPDSLLQYHDYTLNLDAGSQGAAARRFVQLRSGLALPAYAVVPRAPSPAHREQQDLTDLIVPVGGTSLVAPSDANAGLGPRWNGSRRDTRFVLTTLTDTDLGSIRDTTAIKQLFVGPGTTRTAPLVARQVYAFRTTDQPRPTFGLLLVQTLPSGTTQGLRLRVLVAKQLR